MLRSWKFWAVLVAIFGLVALFAFGFTTDPKVVRSPLVKLEAPLFEISRLGGKEKISLAALRGTPVVLNFWASWCAACRDEAHLLQATHVNYEQQGGKLRVVGIAIQDTEQAALAFARKFGKTYFLGLDNERGDISLNYGLYGVPETFFIDRQGRILFKQVGAVTPEVLQREIGRLLASEGAP